MFCLKKKIKESIWWTVDTQCKCIYVCIYKKKK